MSHEEDLLKLLEHHKKLSYQEMGDQLHLSLSTIRRNLLKLEQDGHIRRIRGGAVMEVTQNQDISYAYRSQIMADEKRHIADIASTFIGEGMSLFLDSSGTASKLLPFLRRIPRLTILTSSLKTAYDLIQADLPEAKIFIMGGEVVFDGATVLGLHDNALINQMHVDLAILSPTGMDVDGLYMANYQQMLLLDKMKKQAKHHLILLDHSKIGKAYAYKLCPLEQVETVITDRPPQEALQTRLEQADVECLY